MAVNLNKSTPQKKRKNGASKKNAGSISFVVQADHQEKFIFHDQKKRITVVPLYCDCGRSILVRPKDVQNAPVICSLCNSSFSWQQLSFKLD